MFLPLPLFLHFFSLISQVGWTLTDWLPVWLSDAQFEYHERRNLSLLTILSLQTAFYMDIIYYFDTCIPMHTHYTIQLPPTASSVAFVAVVIVVVQMQQKQKYYANRRARSKWDVVKRKREKNDLTNWLIIYCLHTQAIFSQCAAIATAATAASVTLRLLFGKVFP